MAIYGSILGCHSLGTGNGYWPLVGRGQRCCNMQDFLQYAGHPPLSENYPSPSVNTAEVGRPDAGVRGYGRLPRGSDAESEN